MEKTLEFELRKKRREVPGTPEKRRGEQGATNQDCEKVSEQFGGIFQGR